MSFTESSHSPAKTRTRNVMAFGTFDIFHPGHVYYLSEAETLGERLIIIIARDNRVTQLKWRTPQDDELTRLRNVAYAFPHAEVFLGDEADIFAPLRLYQPDILVFWYDQRVPEEQIRELFPTLEIVRTGGYEIEKWKSSILREGAETK